jgi:O-antigen ligase
MIGVVLAFSAVVSVVAFGGVETLDFIPAQLAVACLFVITVWKHGWPPISRFTRTVLVVLLAIPILQLIPMPRWVLGAIAPHRLALADDLPGVFVARQEFLSLSYHPYETELAFLRLLCYVMVFLLAFQNYSLYRKQTLLVGTLIALGTLEAVYGIVQHLTGWYLIPLDATGIYAREARGTYVNRNHFAGLLEMVLPFLLAGILFRDGPRSSGHRPSWLRALVSPVSSYLLRDTVLITFLLVALLFSRSRMGIASAMAGAALVIGVSIVRGPRRSRLFFLLLGLALFALLVSWIGLSPVLERFELLERPGYAEQTRLPIWRDTATLIRENFLLGAGLGTYQWSSMHYQTSMLNMRYGHAHNDYLEFAADIGIPGALLLFSSLWALVLRVGRSALEFPHFRDRAVAAGCAGAMAAILIHGITDFNLQIPANAFIFACVAGTAAALVQERSKKKLAAKQQPPVTPWQS